MNTDLQECVDMLMRYRNTYLSHHEQERKNIDDLVAKVRRNDTKEEPPKKRKTHKRAE